MHFKNFHAINFSNFSSKSHWNLKVWNCYKLVDAQVIFQTFLCGHKMIEYVILTYKITYVLRTTNLNWWINPSNWLPWMIGKWKMSLNGWLNIPYELRFIRIERTSIIFSFREHSNVQISDHTSERKTVK